MPNRHEFLQRAAAGAAAFGLPLALAERAFGTEAPALPPAKLFSADPDRYWAELRRQWLLAADNVNLNSGSVGCTPLPVLNAMIDHLLSAEAFRESAYPWFGYEENPRLRRLRDALTAYRGKVRSGDGPLLSTALRFSSTGHLASALVKENRA